MIGNFVPSGKETIGREVRNDDSDPSEWNGCSLFQDHVRNTDGGRAEAYLEELRGKMELTIFPSRKCGSKSR